ncbi:YolD-like family protein [Priestia aryabhattai]|uniref:YolD-like family protein n=1 Tax=Priestia aryabhattai TaxID=412384 RepID=UPI001CCF8518|nr:YolD-like family protein [Priestia aryabhattai]MBZ6485096.1 YolD-like family protein [Priestia aryabhattai]
MVKWEPFRSITEQWTGLHNIMEDLNKIENPILSDDQLEEINQVLAEALQNKKRVYLTYYKNDQCIAETCMIHMINLHNKNLYYIDDVFEFKNELPLSEVLDFKFV